MGLKRKGGKMLYLIFEGGIFGQRRVGSWKLAISCKRLARVGNTERESNIMVGEKRACISELEERRGENAREAWDTRAYRPS